MQRRGKKEEVSMDANVVKKKDILAGIEEVAKIVREYCRDQKALWQRIPYLAFQADGRRGFISYYEEAYSQGYWTASEFKIAVDLATGELVDPQDHSKAASDRFVFEIALWIEKLDAKRIITEIEKDIKEPFFHPPEKLEAWRAKTLKETDVQPIYERKRHDA
jgi:hypothetical protein